MEDTVYIRPVEPSCIEKDVTVTKCLVRAGYMIPTRLGDLVKSLSTRLGWLIASVLRRVVRSR